MATSHHAVSGGGGVVNGYPHREWGRGWVCGGGVMVRGSGSLINVVVILSHFGSVYL